MQFPQECTLSETQKAVVVSLRRSLDRLVREPDPTLQAAESVGVSARAEQLARSLGVLGVEIRRREEPEHVAG